eukprot:16442363-Heterocapsa_arctica.AAC.1
MVELQDRPIVGFASLHNVLHLLRSCRPDEFDGFKFYSQHQLNTYHCSRLSLALGLLRPLLPASLGKGCRLRVQHLG